MNWTLLIVTNTFDAMITGSILKGKKLSKTKSNQDKVAIKVHNIGEHVDTKPMSEAKSATAPQEQINDWVRRQLRRFPLINLKIIYVSTCLVRC